MIRRLPRKFLCGQPFLYIPVNQFMPVYSSCRIALGGGTCLATILVDCRSMLWKLFQGRTFLNGFFAMFYNKKKNILRLKNIGVSLQRQHNFENQSCKQARHIQFMPHFLKIMVGDGAYLHVTDLPEER